MVAVVVLQEVTSYTEFGVTKQEANHLSRRNSRGVLSVQPVPGYDVSFFIICVYNTSGSRGRREAHPESPLADPGGGAPGAPLTAADL